MRKWPEPASLQSHGLDTGRQAMSIKLNPDHCLVSRTVGYLLRLEACLPVKMEKSDMWSDLRLICARDRTNDLPSADARIPTFGKQFGMTQRTSLREGAVYRSWELGRRHGYG
jgi:hypothetical protein